MRRCTRLPFLDPDFELMFIAAGPFIIGFFAILRGRGLALVSANYLLSSDDRAPLNYLRAFDDDGRDRRTLNLTAFMSPEEHCRGGGVGSSSRRRPPLDRRRIDTTGSGASAPGGTTTTTAGARSRSIRVVDGSWFRKTRRQHSPRRRLIGRLRLPRRSRNRGASACWLRAARLEWRTPLKERGRAGLFGH